MCPERLFRARRSPIHNNATLADRTITSNESGAFTLTNLAPGDYTVRATKAGFQATTLNDVHLDPSIGRKVDIAMKVGDTSITITVEAGVNTVQTESGAVGQLITQEQVKSIQLNGRNPLYLSQMEPGVVRTNPMASFSFGLDNGINVNGARSQESVITYDGAPMVRTRSNGTSVGVADVDSTSQVQVLTTSYPAEFGRTSGGQIRMIPKSGTSDFHGSVFEYFRNTALNANTWARNNTGLKRQRFPLQPIRMEFEWSHLHSRPLQSRPQKALLPRRTGVDKLQPRRSVTTEGSDGTDAYRQLQRVARPQHLLQLTGADREPDHGCSLPQQRHSAKPAKPQRHWPSQCLPSAQHSQQSKQLD